MYLYHFRLVCSLHFILHKSFYKLITSSVPFAVFRFILFAVITFLFPSCLLNSRYLFASEMQETSVYLIFRSSSGNVLKLLFLFIFCISPIYFKHITTYMHLKRCLHVFSKPVRLCTKLQMILCSRTSISLDRTIVTVMWKGGNLLTK